MSLWWPLLFTVFGVHKIFVLALTDSDEQRPQRCTINVELSWNYLRRCKPQFDIWNQWINKMNTSNCIYLAAPPWAWFSWRVLPAKMEFFLPTLSKCLLTGDRLDFWSFGFSWMMLYNSTEQFFRYCLKSHYSSFVLSLAVCYTEKSFHKSAADAKTGGRIQFVRLQTDEFLLNS